MIVRTRRQHPVLAEMRRSLCRSDPRLVARFTLFNRLTMDEDIPSFERVRGWAGRWAVVIIRRRRLPVDGRACWRIAGMLLVPAAVTAMFSLLLTFGHSGSACATPRTAAGVAQQARQQPPARGYWPVPGCPSAQVPMSAKGH